MFQIIQTSEFSLISNDFIALFSNRERTNEKKILKEEGQREQGNTSGNLHLASDLGQKFETTSFTNQALNTIPRQLLFK